MRPGFGSLIAVTIVCAVPFGQASAQVPNEKIGQLDACASSWAQADRNGDGWLDKATAGHPVASSLSGERFLPRRIR